MRNWAKTGAVILAATVATATGARAEERARPASLARFAWTAGHEPVRCDLSREFATGALLAPVRVSLRPNAASHRVRDNGDISIDDLQNGFRKQAADRLGSAAALGALSSLGGQQVAGAFTRADDHER